MPWKQSLTYLGVLRGNWQVHTSSWQVHSNPDDTLVHQLGVAKPGFLSPELAPDEQTFNNYWSGNRSGNSMNGNLRRQLELQQD